MRRLDIVKINKCNNKGCGHNEDGKCTNSWGIEIDQFGECASVQFLKKGDKDDAESSRESK